MLEILQYIPKGKIEIRFLNEPDKITLEQGSRTPKEFYEQSKWQILNRFLPSE